MKHDFEQNPSDTTVATNSSLGDSPTLAEWQLDVRAFFDQLSQELHELGAAIGEDLKPIEIPTPPPRPVTTPQPRSLEEALRAADLNPDPTWDPDIASQPGTWSQLSEWPATTVNDSAPIPETPESESIFDDADGSHDRLAELRRQIEERLGQKD